MIKGKFFILTKIFLLIFAASFLSTLQAKTLSYEYKEENYEKVSKPVDSVNLFIWNFNYTGLFDDTIGNMNTGSGLLGYRYLNPIGNFPGVSGGNIKAFDFRLSLGATYMSYELKSLDTDSYNPYGSSEPEMKTESKSALAGQLSCVLAYSSLTFDPLPSNSYKQKGSGYFFGLEVKVALGDAGSGETIQYGPAVGYESISFNPGTADYSSWFITGMIWPSPLMMSISIGGTFNFGNDKSPVTSTINLIDQDISIYEKIKKLESKKNDAIASEDYELASRLKNDIKLLKEKTEDPIYKKIRKLENKKKKAVAKENFKLALKLKKEINLLKAGLTSKTFERSQKKSQEKSDKKNDIEKNIYNNNFFQIGILSWYNKNQYNYSYIDGTSDNYELLIGPSLYIVYNNFIFEFYMQHNLIKFEYNGGEDNISRYEFNSSIIYMVSSKFGLITGLEYIKSESDYTIGRYYNIPIGIYLKYPLSEKTSYFYIDIRYYPYCQFIDEDYEESDTVEYILSDKRYQDDSTYTRLDLELGYKFNITENLSILLGGKLQSIDYEEKEYSYKQKDYYYGPLLGIYYNF
jgi:UvrB/UvrC motif-containing protein